jgi:hypothetical protein
MVGLLLIAAKLQDRQITEDSLIRAKMAAEFVEKTGRLNSSAGLRSLVLLAIKMNDKGFFIDFGKCLSHEIKNSTLFDKRDRDLAEIILFSPQLSAKAAVRELKKRGHREITEENFRMWKMRLLKAKPIMDAVIADDTEFYTSLWA